jgi:hypothetical protein
MNKLLSYAVVLLVGFGFGFVTFHKGANESPVGGIYNTNPTQFINGFSAGTTNQLAVDSAGNATTTGSVRLATSTVTGLMTSGRFGTLSNGVSSSSPAALGTAASGFFTATGTTQSASSSAITTTSQIFLQQVMSSSTVPSASLFGSGPWSCNQTPATTTVVKLIIASSTSPSNNGFVVQPYAAPSGSVTPLLLLLLDLELVLFLSRFRAGRITSLTKQQ